MRILHCVFTRGLFGSERYAADLARRQAELGHEVHIAVAPGARLPEILDRRIVVHRIGRLLRAWRLKKLIARIGPDIAHAHLSAACKALGAIADRPPAVATLHVGYKAHQHGRLDGLIALTASAAASAEAFHGPTALIWNWAPETAPPPPDAREATRAALGIAPQTYVVGYVARLHHSKNPQLLVRAFKAAALDDAVLLMAGEGKERAEVEALAAGRPDIRILGYRNDAPFLLRAIDLFALPSRFEQQPLVLLEAMTAELPLIATSIESIAGFLPAPPARLFPDEDEAALVALLRRERSLGQRRQPYDMAPFRAETQVARILDFYEQVIA